MSISAASLIPVIILTGITGSTLLLIENKHSSIEEANKKNGAALWRIWGRAGCASALFFYLLEYYPGPYDIRLEVNHPIHALAWLGGAEIIAILTGPKNSRLKQRFIAEIGFAVLLLMLPLLLFYYKGSSIFLPADPFINKIHAEISEFRPFWQESTNFKTIYVITLLPLFIVFFNPIRGAGDLWCKIPRYFMLLTLATSVLALYQERWWLVAGATQIIQATMITQCVGSKSKSGRIAWACLVGLMYLPSIWVFAKNRFDVERIADVQKGEAMQLIYRDLANTILRRNPKHKVALLASPNASVGIGYYGNIQTIGTLYWENREGLHTAAEILSGEDNSKVEIIIKQQGISHIVMVTPEDFTEEYIKALGIPAKSERVNGSFGRRLMTGTNIPNWLEAIPYQVPPAFSRLQVKVYIYEVNWQQSAAEAQWALGLARILSGEEILGRKALSASANGGKAEAGMVLAWRLATDPNATLSDGNLAVRWAESSIKLLAEKAAHRRVLAAAYAAAQRWSDAQATCLFAIDLAKEENDRDISRKLEAEFSRYQNSLPFPN
jgi:hypothetical protein